MSECPQGTCNGLEGVKKDSITKGTIKWGIGLLLVIIMAFATAWGTTRNDVNENKTNIAVMIESLRGINDKLDDLKDTQLTKEDVHEAISKRIRR